MTRFIYSFISISILVITNATAQYSYQPPLSQGHVIAPEYSYFNKDCSKVLTVSKADAILWDIASGKPVYKANLASSIREYNPFDKRWTVNAVPSPDLNLLIIELVAEGGAKQAFLFDMKTGKLRESLKTLYFFYSEFSGVFFSVYFFCLFRFTS